MKFNFRKITSALASTAMLGSTFALAAAASFPAPFVQNGNADVALVYGSNLDLVAVTDISTALSSALSSGGTGTPASTDAYALFTSSTPLQLNASLNSIRSSVTDANLPTVLGDTDFSGNVDAEATFQVVLGSNPRVIFAKEPTTSDEPSVGLTIGTTVANYLYNATVTFDEAVNFTHEDSEGESITLFGQDFTVSSATDTDSLVLFKSAQTVSLSVGSSTSVPSETVEVDGETYTIELIAASDTSATVKVTNSAGQSDQKEINEAASKKILGVEVAVNTADESTATNIIQAEILVGANRITLENGNEVKLGTDNEAIDGTQVTFAGTTYPGNLTKFTVQIYAEDGSHDFFAAGDEFVDPVFGSFRLTFDGLAVNLDDADEREEIAVKPSGTDMGAITFTSWQGETLTGWEWLNNQTGNGAGAKLADDNDWPLIVRELAVINESGFTVAGNEDEGVLLELTSLNNDSSATNYGDDVVEFTNVMTGDKYTGSETSEGVGTINIEGNSFTYTYVDDRSGSGQFVRLNSPDSTTAGQLVLYPTIETSKGANVAFYEPLTIDFGDVDGTGQDATGGFKLPDGDGYIDVAVTFGGGVNNWTINGAANELNITLGAADSVSVAIGRLTYNFTGSGNVANNQTTVYLIDPTGGTSAGGNILRPAIVLFEEQDESDTYQAVVIETSGAGVSDAGVSVGEASFTWNGDTDMRSNAYGAGFELESTDDIFVKLDQWGTLSTIDQTDSDQNHVTLSYPDAQATALIYIDSLATGSGSTTLGDVKVMDDELSSSGMSSKNLIVVGGSCVNTAASSLLGNAGCGASWTAATGAGSGEWVIQTFANPWMSSKVATLVAGWEQGDTANAATYLKTQNPETGVGHKLTGTTATAATVVTA